MRKLLTTSVLLLTVAWASSAAAYRSGTAKIVAVEPYNAGFALVKMDTSLSTSKPACANSGNNEWFAFAVSTDGGKAIFSALLAAHLAGRDVFFRGDDTCNAVATFEDLKYARVQ